MNRRQLQAIAILAIIATWPLSGCASQSKSQKDTSETPPSSVFEPGPGRVILSVQGLDCMSCGKKVVDAVKAVEGVTTAEFVGDRVEVGVAFDEAKTNAKTQAHTVRPKTNQHSAEGLGIVGIQQNWLRKKLE